MVSGIIHGTSMKCLSTGKFFPFEHFPHNIPVEILTEPQNPIINCIFGELQNYLSIVDGFKLWLVLDIKGLHWICHRVYN